MVDEKLTARRSTAARSANNELTDKLRSQRLWEPPKHAMAAKADAIERSHDSADAGGRHAQLKDANAQRTEQPRGYEESSKPTAMGCKTRI